MKDRDLPGGAIRTSQLGMENTITFLFQTGAREEDSRCAAAEKHLGVRINAQVCSGWSRVFELNLLPTSV